MYAPNDKLSRHAFYADMLNNLST